MKIISIAALSLFLFVTFIVTSCSDDDGESHNFFVVDGERHGVVDAARIGVPVRIENVEGQTLYRHEVRFFENRYTRIDKLYNGPGWTVLLWFNTYGEEIEPGHYDVFKGVQGYPGKIDECYLIESDSERVVSNLSLIDRKGSMEIKRSGDIYTISYDLEFETRQLPVVLNGYYQGSLKMIQP